MLAVVDARSCLCDPTQSHDCDHLISSSAVPWRPVGDRWTVAWGSANITASGPGSVRIARRVECPVRS